MTVGVGRLLVGQLAEGTLCGCLGEHIWLPVVGPKLEIGADEEAVCTTQVLAVWGHLKQGLFFNFLD